MRIDETREVIGWLWASRGHPNPHDPIVLDAWHELVGDLSKEDVIDVIVEHQRSLHPSFLMPATIRFEVGLRQIANAATTQEEA